jgi:TonB family protein
VKSRFLWFVLLVSHLFVPPLLAESTIAERRAAGIISSPEPKYPFEARLHCDEGAGRFQIEFNSAGRAQTVTVVKSTGHAILDKACIETFYQWQVKPNAFEKMIVPINFHMSGEEAAVLRRLRAHLVWAVAPVAPIDTRMHGIGGAGHFQLTIDPNTGRVTDIKIVKTTGDRRLDEASIKALRQWRFAPHTESTITVPVTF